jgi:hypothetical protein
MRQFRSSAGPERLEWQKKRYEDQTSRIEKSEEGSQMRCALHGPQRKVPDESSIIFIPSLTLDKPIVEGEE